jgi:hypothetical protein
MDCINIAECENPAAVTLDITESTTATGSLEFPSQPHVPYCSECAADLTRILIENGTLLSIRVAARLI